MNIYANAQRGVISYGTRKDHDIPQKYCGKIDLLRVEPMKTAPAKLEGHPSMPFAVIKQE